MGTASQIQSTLRSQSLPIPSTSWLLTTLPPPSSSRQPPPLPSLVMTARTRLLASDLTTPSLLDPTYLSSHTFPPGNANPPKETCLTAPVLVQVLDIENTSRSRWDQVEELESIERGEQTRGRQVIRLPTNTDSTTQADQGDEAATPAPTDAAAREREKQAKNATHKLVVQDAKGQKMFALELRRIDRFAVGTLQVGEKMLIKSGTTVARGVLLLEPANCQILGGKVEAWHKAWVEGRLERLREAVGADRR